MTDQNASSPKTVQRGTGFPGLPLDDAVEAVKSAGQYGRSHSDVAFAGYLGHSSANSGPFRAKMAALRDWGLIERPKNAQVPLTDLGHEIAHPTGDERALLQRAFFSARPFASIYEESAKGTDLSLDLIANRAVTVLGVSPQNKGRFAESFRRSVVAAGLGRPGSTDGTIQLTPEGAEPATLDANAGARETLVPPAKPLPAVAASVEPVMLAGRPPIIHQEWPIAGGRVVFEVSLDGTLPGSAFGDVANVMTAVENFVSSLKPVEEPTSPTAAQPDTDDGAAE